MKKRIVLFILVILIAQCAQGKDNGQVNRDELGNLVVSRLPALFDVLEKVKQKSILVNPQERDLEVITPSKYTDKIFSIIFDTLTEKSKATSRTIDGGTEQAVDFQDIYSIMKLIEFLPPIRRIAEAWDRWNAYAGGENAKVMTSDTLSEAFRELFGYKIETADAEKMIASVMINPRSEGSAPQSLSIGRCEFTLASLRRGFLDEKLVRVFFPFSTFSLPLFKSTKKIKRKPLKKKKNHSKSDFLFSADKHKGSLAKT